MPKLDIGVEADDNCPMTGRSQRIFPLVLAASLSAIPASGAVSSIAQSASRCRCVDDPLAAIDLPVTDQVPEVKMDKTYPPEWKASQKQGMHRFVTTFYNVHSNEALPVLDGRLPPAAVLDRFFRCRGFGTIHHLEDVLPQTAIAAAQHFNSPRIEVISGYRSPKFNDALAKKGRHVAMESKHTRGSAMDFRLTTAEASETAAWLYNNFDGGVGMYSVNNFVHIDTGPKRRWRGR